MMDHFYKLIFVNPNTLTDSCFTHASVRAFVNRIHAINPDDIPKSAEVFYIRDEARFKQEAMAFIMQNRREGYIGDMFTFFYLFCEMFKVDVHLFYGDREDVVLSVVAFAKYHIYISYSGERFSLFLPRLKLTQYMRPMGIIKSPSRTSIPQFEITTLKKPMIPPNILGYRVHYLSIYETGLHALEPLRGNTWKRLLKCDEYLYVFGKIVSGNKLKCISCVSRDRGQCGPRFYVDNIPFEIYVIPERTIDEAAQAVWIECNP